MSDSESEVDEQMEAIAQWRAMAKETMPTPQRTLARDFVAHVAAPRTRDDYEEVRRTTLLMIHSSDRDQRAYPLPTQVRLKLPRDYRNVERIEVVHVRFFCGLYTISSARRNTSFGFSDSRGTHVATIPEGTYGLTALLVAVATAMCTASGGYQVTYDAVRGRVSICGDGPFTLRFLTDLPVHVQRSRPQSEWGLGWVLGWGGVPTDVSGTTVTAGHFPRIAEDHVFLQLNETEQMNEIDHTDIEVQGKDTTGQVAHYFGKVVLADFGQWTEAFIGAPKVFDTALGRLERMSVTWLDRRGRALLGADAASCEWHMTLRITERVEVKKGEQKLGVSR